MKKILVVCAAISTLLCLPLRAQEADDAGSTGVGFSIIPRLDLSPEFTDGKGEFTLGNSSLYTLFEGNITENLSFSVANHWMSFWGTDPLMDDTKALYNHTFWRSDTNNWLDWAYLSYEAGPWTFTLGKNTMLTGGYEYDEYDWNVHPTLASSFWNYFQCYQWGGRIGYSFTEDHTISMEMTTSPYGERPFSSGRYALSVGWDGTMGPITTKWSYSAIQREDDWTHLFYLGTRFEADYLTLTLDLSNKIGHEDIILENGFSAQFSMGFQISDHFEAIGKIGMENFEQSQAKEPYYDSSRHEWVQPGPISTSYKSEFQIGAALHWFPLRDSKDLRVHATAAHNSFLDTATLSVGVLYNLNLL